MEDFYFKLNPKIYEFEGDEKTIYRFEQVGSEYKVFFKLNEDDEDEVSVDYTLEELTQSLVSGHWIIIE